MYFVVISLETVIFSLYLSVFVTDTACVYSAARDESLHTSPVHVNLYTIHYTEPYYYAGISNIRSRTFKVTRKTNWNRNILPTEGEVSFSSFL
jgi:hypothetical protein